MARSASDTPPPPSVLLLLVGIPAAGKSSLATCLLRSGHTAAGLASADVNLVSYDDLFDELASSTADAAVDFDPATWHASRQEALGRAAALLQEHSSTANKRGAGAGKSRASQKMASADRGNGRHVRVVVLDDTFHYRSMRREARRVARACGAGMVLVHVDEPVDVCVRRNACRLPLSRRVPEQSLRRIHAAIERPGAVEPMLGAGIVDSADDVAHSASCQNPETSKSRLWEEGAEVVVVRPSQRTSDENESDGSDILEPQQPPCDEVLQNIWGAVARAWALPALQSTEDVAAAAAAAATSRAVTDKSILHAADLALRKILGRAMSAVQTAAIGLQKIGRSASLGMTAVSSGKLQPATPPMAVVATSAEDMTIAVPPIAPAIESRQLAQIFNNQRKLLLQEFRQGTLIIDGLSASRKEKVGVGGSKCGEREDGDICSSSGEHAACAANGSGVGNADNCELEEVLMRAFLRRIFTELRRIEITEGRSTTAIQEALNMKLVNFQRQGDESK